MGSGNTTLMISNEEMNDIMKIVQALEDSKKRGFLSMLLGTLGATLLGKLLIRKGIGTHWIALFYNRNEIVYFNSFGVEHIPEDIKEFIKNKNIKANNFRVQANNSVMCRYFCIGFIKANDTIILSYVKMNKCDSIEAIDKTNLSEQTKFRLNEISKAENYFIEEINQRKSCSKKLSRYVTAFDCIDKVLVVLSETTGRVSFFSCTGIVGALVGIASASFTLIFSLLTGITKKLLNITTKKKEEEE